VATPVRGDVGEVFESMRNAMVDFFFVRIGLVIGFADTFGDDLWITLAMARVFAIGALHTSRILQEIPTKRTAHDVVELLSNELVPLLLVDLFFLLANGTLTIKTNVKRTSIFHLFG
jgi:hypothetical protein